MNLPNIRELFLPDPGYLIAEADLDRADLQVVIAEADDKDLREKCRLGVDLHIANGLDLFQKPIPPIDELIPSHPNYHDHYERNKKIRRFAKSFIHGTNYGGKAPTMAKASGCSVQEADRAQRRWFSAHPGIKRWHERTLESLNKTRSVWNQFGFRRFYFGRLDNALPEALAWVPQSTVAIVIDLGIDNIDLNLLDVEPLLQVHDSVVMQYPIELDTILRPKIRDNLLIEIPYPDPLIIGVGLKTSLESWGKTEEVPWEVAA